MLTPVELSEIPHPLRVEGWKRMSPVERLQIAGDSLDFCRDWFVVNLRHREPDLSEQEIVERLRRYLLRG